MFIIPFLSENETLFFIIHKFHVSLIVTLYQSFISSDFQQDEFNVILSLTIVKSL